MIEHDGQDLRNSPFLDRKAALALLLRDTEAGILLNEHLAEDGAAIFEHACQLGAEGIVSKKVDGTYRSGPVARSGSRSAIPPASRCSGSAARSGINERQKRAQDFGGYHWPVLGKRQSPADESDKLFWSR